MAKLRLSIIAGFILLPPVLYVAVVHLLELQAGKQIQAGLERSYLGDVTPLLKGHLPLKPTIRQNVNQYLAQSPWSAMGCQISVTVKTRKDSLLYPLYDTDNPSLADEQLDPMKIAVENYRLISETPFVITTLKIPHQSFLALSVLGGCVLLSFGGISIYYRKWQKHNRELSRHQADEYEKLKSLSEQYRGQLSDLELEHAVMTDELKRMESTVLREKDKTTANEEEMFDEIVALEDKISEKTRLYEKQQQEIEQLQIKIEKIEKNNQKKPSSKTKPAEMAKKRLKTLYKNITIGGRAVTGYLDLPEEMKIKCEEIIHQLNENPSKVQIKRKVFGKKNRITVLEVVFGYKGRIYYRQQGSQNLEVLAIGTKNSQQTDLAFLERL